jgi:hypothetical protein
MSNKTHNAILEGKDSLGKDFIEKHGDKYKIINSVHSSRNSFIIRVESIKDEYITVVNLENDKNFKIKFT